MKQSVGWNVRVFVAVPEVEVVGLTHSNFCRPVTPVGKLQFCDFLGCADRDEHS